ncbi:MAG: hypothetical protein NTV52_09305 [Acidobacteria bacterium]|nr:hypothetical protein [Acidobacteriota bacterium]
MLRTNWKQNGLSHGRIGALLRLGCVFLPLLVQAANLEVRPVTVPAGAMAQIRVELGAPLAVSVGSLRVELDGAVFGDIADVQMFSAAGDLLGTAEWDGRKAVVKFSSVAGGVGRIGGSPVMTVTAPVSGTAGAQGRVTVSALDWRDVAGEKFVVGDGLGMVTVGEAVVIEAVTRVGASSYRVTGRGFTAESRVTGEGMKVDRVAFRSGTELEVTVAGEGELTGRVFRVEGAEFVYAVRMEPVGGRRAFLPTQMYSSVEIGRQATPLGGGPALLFLENPHAVAVEVTGENFDLIGALSGRQTIVLPPRSLSENLRTLGFEATRSGGLLASMPIRAAFGRPLVDSLFAVSSGYEPFRLPAAPFSIPSTPIVFRQSGAQTVTLGVNGRTFEVTPIAVTTTERWLTAGVERQDSRSVSLSVRAEIGGMLPGDYLASVVVTPKDPGYEPQSIPVRLEVRAGEFIRLSPGAITLTSVPEGPITRAAGFAVRAENGASVPITLRTETDDGGRWLTVSTAATTTPAGPDVQANPAGLRAGTYRGRVMVRGPINEETLEVTLVVATPGVPVPLRLLSLTPGSLNFSRQVLAEGAPLSIGIQVTPFVASLGLAVLTESGGAWLEAVGSGSAITVTVNPRGLNLVVGIYRGSVKVSAPGAVNTLELPVTLRIWGGETEPLVVTPAAVSVADGQSGKFLVTSSGAPLEATALVEKEANGCALRINASKLMTPAEFSVFCVGPPGRYEGSVRITAGSRSVVVPVSVVIGPLAYTGLVNPAVVNTVANGASNRLGALAAGQYVALHGVGKDRQVTFDGLPARVLFESQFQTNVVVPEGVRGRSSTTIRVGSGEAVTVAVEEAAPGLFTMDGTGVGQGAILNQDNAVNAAERPAARGSVVQIFATGDGSVPGASVTIGGIGAPVIFAAVTVPGLFQVNAVVPEGVASGAAVPVTLQVGRFQAQTGVTMAVR